MYNMMDPELMRIAQEQMSRISPEELARIQQQMISNPELMKIASESMKNMSPEDLKRAAEQMKHTRAEDMVEMSEKVSKATPGELAAMRARVDAQISYEMNAAQMLKQQGNQLHSRGQYHDAANKYMLAKNNLQGIPSSKGGTLRLQCSLNLMSCYLKTGQFDECVKEGSEVLVYDSKNLKAFYRRGQAYKELENLEASVSDLRMAHELSPEDETIADMFRDVNKKLKDGDKNASRSLVIEEIEDEEVQPNASESKESSSLEYAVSQPVEADECSRNGGSHVGVSTKGVESLQSFKDNPETVRLFQNYVSNANPDSLAAMGVGGMPPDMVKTATDMISKMKPEDLQKMLQAASALNGKSPSLPTLSNTNGDGSNFSSQIPEMTPEMVKMASDRLSTMSPEDLQKMLDIASSVNVNGSPFSSSTTDTRTRKSEDGSTIGSQLPAMTPEMIKMASDSMRKMSPEELQKMFEIASSMNVNSTPFPAAANRDSSQISESESHSSAAAGSRSVGEFDAGLTSTAGLLSNSRTDSSTSGFPASSADMKESMRNSMKDPAMRQMFTSMMKDISPEMMETMSEQFGMKLSREDAEKLQRQMSSLRPEDLDKMMRWAERAQRGVEAVKKTKNWVLGRPGLILAMVMLVLAFIFHQLGFIGG